MRVRREIIGWFILLYALGGVSSLGAIPVLAAVTQEPQDAPIHFNQYVPDEYNPIPPGALRDFIRTVIYSDIDNLNIWEIRGSKPTMLSAVPEPLYSLFILAGVSPPEAIAGPPNLAFWATGLEFLFVYMRFVVPYYLRVAPQKFTVTPYQTLMTVLLFAMNAWPFFVILGVTITLLGLLALGAFILILLALPIAIEAIPIIKAILSITASVLVIVAGIIGVGITLIIFGMNSIFIVFAVIVVAIGSIVGLPLIVIIMTANNLTFTQARGELFPFTVPVLSDIWFKRPKMDELWSIFRRKRRAKMALPGLGLGRVFTQTGHRPRSLQGQVRRNIKKKKTVRRKRR